MHDEDASLPGDHEPSVMTMDERSVWAYLSAAVVTSGAYFAVMIPRALSQPIEDISWVTPMLWAIGASVIGTPLATAALFAVGAIGVKRRGRKVSDELASDVRDTEIGRIGTRATVVVIGIGFGAAMVLSMLDAHTFWIGNVLFLFGTASAIVETTVKIRLYRRGF